VPSYSAFAIASVIPGRSFCQGVPARALKDAVKPSVAAPMPVVPAIVEQPAEGKATEPDGKRSLLWRIFGN
jgi:hypothetical protein